MLGIGVATNGEWASLGLATYAVIDIDVDGDGTVDLETAVWKYDASADVTVAQTFDATTGKTLDVEPVNGFYGDVDAGVFDSNVFVAPISLAAAHIPAGATPTVSVSMYSPYAADPSGVVDTAPTFTVNPYDPPFWFDNNVPDSFTSVGLRRCGPARAQGHGRRDGQAAGAEEPEPRRRVPLAGRRRDGPGTGRDDDHAVGRGRQDGRQAAHPHGDRRRRRRQRGTVTFLDGTTPLGSAPVDKGKARVTVTLGAGKHSLTAAFAPSDGAYAASTSAAVTVDIKRSTSTTTLKLSHNSASFGSATTATVTVTGASAAPSGDVTIKDRGLVIGTGTLVVAGRVGTATIALPTDLAARTHQLTAVFAGSADVVRVARPAVLHGDAGAVVGGAVGDVVDGAQGQHPDDHGEGHRSRGRTGTDGDGRRHAEQQARRHRAAVRRRRHDHAAGGPAIGAGRRHLRRRPGLPGVDGQPRRDGDARS